MATPQSAEPLWRVLVANDGELLGRLRLSAAEAARVCDVTPRQLANAHGARPRPRTVGFAMTPEDDD